MVKPPFETPFASNTDVPGGVLGQLLFQQLRSHAEQQSGIDSFYFGNASPLAAVKGNAYDNRQAMMLQLAAEQEARHMSLMLSSPFVMAGRERSPELMQSLGAFSSFVSPTLASMAAQSGDVRSLMSMFSGGMSQVNVGLGVEGLSRRMRDPITGANGMSAGSFGAIADNFYDVMQQRETLTRSDGSVVPFGPRASRGMSELDLLQTAAAMSFRGQLPTRSMLLDLAANDELQAAMDRGDISPDSFSKRPDSLNRMNRVLAGQGYNPYDGMSEGLTELRSKGLDSRVDVEAFRELTRTRDREIEVSRDSLQGLAIQNDQAASDFLLNGQRSYDRFLPDGSSTRYNTLQTIRMRDAAGGGTPMDKFIADSIAKGFQDPQTMSLDEFDRRALEFAATTGSKLGRLAPEEAKDLAAALNAAQQGDMVALGETQYGRLGRDEKLAHIATLTGQDTEAVGVAISGYTPEQLRKARAGRADEFDPYLLGELKKIETDLASPSDGAAAIIQTDIAKRFNRAIVDRTKAISAAKDFLTSEELSKSIAEVNTMAEQLVTQLSGNSAHQISGASMEQSIRYIQTAANRVGYSRDQILAIASMSQQVAQAGGFKNPVAMDMEKRYLESVQRYQAVGSESLGAMGFDVYGLDDRDTMARKDQLVEQDVRRSENAGVAAIASVLSRMAGVNVDENSVTGKLVRENNAGAYGDETNAFLDGTRGEKLAQLAKDTGRPLSEIIRMANNPALIEGELQKTRATEAMMERARNKSFDRAAPLMQMTAGDLATRSGMVGTEREEFTRNLTQGLTRLARDSSATLIADTTSDSPLANTFASGQLAAIKERARKGSASDRKFLDGFGGDDEKAMTELKVTMEQMAYEYELGAGQKLVGLNLQAGKEANVVERANRERDKMESTVAMLLSDYEPDAKRRALGMLNEAGKTGVGRSLTDTITNFLGLDTSGEVPQTLRDAADKYSQIQTANAKTLALDRGLLAPGDTAAEQAALDSLINKLQDAIKSSPELSNKAKGIIAKTKAAAASREAGAAGRVDSETAMADIEATAANAIVSADGTVKSGSGVLGGIGTAASGAIAMIKEATVEVINMSGVNISLNGTPVLTNASGTVAPTNRAGLNAVPAGK